MTPPDGYYVAPWQDVFTYVGFQGTKRSGNLKNFDQPNSLDDHET